MSPSEKAHPSPALHFPAQSLPQSTQPNLGQLNSQRSVLDPPRSDLLIFEHTTKDQRSSEPSSFFKVSTQELPVASKASVADLVILESRETVTAEDPVAERRALHPPTALQQQWNTTPVESLAKTVDAPQRREREKEEKAEDADADIVKRLQHICTDADPTRLYRNLVKIGQV